MRIFCFFLCLFALISRAFQTYRRVGNPVYPAVITGFYASDPMTNDYCNFQVQFTYKDEVIDAIAIESTPLTEKNKKKYLGQSVEVYVSEKNPYIVSIKGNHCLDIPCLLLLGFGMWGIIFF